MEWMIQWRLEEHCNKRRLEWETFGYDAVPLLRMKCIEHCENLTHYASSS